MHHGVKQGASQGIGWPFNRFAINQIDAERDLGLAALSTPFALQHLWDYQREGNNPLIAIGQNAVDQIGAANLPQASQATTFEPSPFANHGGWRFRNPLTTIGFLNGATTVLNVLALTNFFHPMIVQFRIASGNREMMGKVGTSPLSYRLFYLGNTTVSWQCTNITPTVFAATVALDHENSYNYCIPFVNQNLGVNISGLKTLTGYAQVGILGAGAFSNGVGNFRQGNVSGSAAPIDILWAAGSLLGAPAGQDEATAIGYNLWRGWRGIKSA